jgi:hypothetical protein
MSKIEKVIKNSSVIGQYVKGVVNARLAHKSTYHLAFNREDNGGWYIDLPVWQGAHDSLEMVAGADWLLEFVGKGAPRVEVEVVKSNEKLKEMENDKRFFRCDQTEQSLMGGATYDVNLEGFNRTMWLCPVTLFVLGEYPKYLYIKPVKKISDEYIVGVIEKLNDDIVKREGSCRSYNGIGFCDIHDDFPPHGGYEKALFLEVFVNLFEEDARRFVQEKGMDFYLSSRFTDARTDFVNFKGYWLWKRNLRGVIVDRNSGLESEVELIYIKNGEWKILKDTMEETGVPGFEILPRSELFSLVERYMPRYVGADLAWNDAMFCVGMGWGMLEEDWKVWEEKKKDYIENPSKYEDITLYDEEGRAYIMQNNERCIYHPESGYWKLLTEDSYDEMSDRSILINSVQYHYLDYDDLSDDKIYPLPGLNKFVKEL